MKTFATICFIFMLMIFCMAPQSFAKGDQGFIYGKILMVNGDVYEGPIRWEDEEVFWTDMFNSNKIENEYIEFVSDDVMEDIDEDTGKQIISIGNIKIKWDGDIDDFDFHGIGATHRFACQFGHIKKIELEGDDDANIYLKNDVKVEVSGGSNDIGADVMVLDDEIGRLSLDWDRIDTIEFMDTPSKLENKFGEPLYGKVETTEGTFEGFIQWDEEECLTTDELDGEYKDGDMSIKFGNIKSIKQHRRGSNVILQSGREYFLYGTNDVNHDNRGIIVKNKDFGRVLIHWDEFDEITFSKPKNSGLSYSDFKKPKQLEGKVKTEDGDTFSGTIVYDLDETYDFELLDAEDDDIEYDIPFYNIKKITPKSSRRSEIELTNGEILRLEKARDVSHENGGLLIWESKDDDPVYVAWEDITEITFD